MLVGNHGAIAVGDTLEHAVANVLVLEWLAEVYRGARQLGVPPLLTPKDLDEVGRQAERLAYSS